MSARVSAVLIQTPPKEPLPHVLGGSHARAMTGPAGQDVHVEFRVTIEPFSGVKLLEGGNDEV